MLIRLHKQATTTPKIRAAIQESDDAGTVLADRFGDEAEKKTIRRIVFPPNADAGKPGSAWPISCARAGPSSPI